MLEIEQATLFDYALLDADTRVFVQEKAQAIHARLKRTAEDVIAIGQDLIAVQGRLKRVNADKNGLFLKWLSANFDLSERTAFNFMAWADRFGERKVAEIAGTSTVLSELYNADEIIIEKVESGRIPATLPAIREAKREVYEERVSLAEIFDPVGNAVPSAFLHSPNTNEGGSTVLPPVEIDRGLHHEDPLPIVIRGVPAALQMSESNEWYTPSAYVEAARELMGGIIDVDPASCESANKIIQAKKFYAKRDNGLMQSWSGRVWLNPPYGFDGGTSNQETWTRELIERYKAGLVSEAVLLVNANTEAKWFQPLYDYLICFTNHRIRFYNTSGESSQPTQGNALVYFGKQESRFKELFSRFGVVVRRA